MAHIFDNVELRKKDGTKKLGKDVFKGKIVALYFSAHWCGPCCAFTPVLKDFYDELVGEDFEVVFVSCDEDECEQMEYINESHGDWYYVPFDDSSREEASDKLDVEGIPTLVIINPNGDVLTKDGREDVHSGSPKATLSKWRAML